MTLDSFHNVVSNNYYNKYVDYPLHAAVRDDTGDTATFYYIIKMYPMAVLVRYKNRLGEYSLHVA
jgi:hypothetical protein